MFLTNNKGVIHEVPAESLDIFKAKGWVELPKKKKTTKRAKKNDKQDL